MTEQDDKMTTEARRLATEIAPSRDLWPGIEAAIQDQTVAANVPRQTPWYAQAAAVFLLVGASSLLTYSVMKYSDSNTPDAPEAVVQVVPTNMMFERAAFGGEHTLDSVYGRAAGNVKSNLDKELENLSPEARADVERNLAVIRQAITDISTALEEDPNNEFLQDLLVQAYRNELALMNRVGSMTQRVMARKDI
ncbi:MAG: hypothetical protein ACR2QS_04210 [Woeseiaceae bacterium]